jgi:carboxypeptidase Taq
VYDGKVKAEELEDAYNDKFREYMGIVPPSVRSGVGQDIHWTLYFGTSYQGYTMGNIAAVQFYKTCLDANPRLIDSFNRGDYSGLLKWTRENVHIHGAKFPPNELITIATGRPLDPKPYIDYIKAKYSELYGFRD